MVHYPVVGSAVLTVKPIIVYVAGEVLVHKQVFFLRKSIGYRHCIDDIW